MFFSVNMEGIIISDDSEALNHQKPNREGDKKKGDDGEEEQEQKGQRTIPGFYLHGWYVTEFLPEW